MDVVYPKINGVVAWSQGQSTLSRNKPIAADHKLVKERPDLFDQDSSRVDGAPRVERATRAPGERRGPGRPRKDSSQ